MYKRSPQKRRLRITLSLACLVFLVNAGFNNAAAANLSAAQLATAMKTAGLVKPGNILDVWLLGDEAIISTSQEASGTDEMMRKQAFKMAKSVTPADLGNVKKLTFVFVDASDHGKKIEFNIDLLKDAEPNSDLAVVPFRRTSSASVGFVSSPKSAPAQYQTDKNALMKRINALAAKRVGVKPYLDKLARVDDQAKRGDLYEAAAGLAYLDSVVEAQEQRFAPAQRPAPPRAVVASSVPASADFLAQFAGKTDDYAEEIAWTILKRECGDLAPARGPFRMERFRIAKAIQQLASKGRNVVSFTAMYKRIDALTLQTASDRRKMNELTDQIQYLQQQLGLPPLQGTSHYKD